MSIPDFQYALSREILLLGTPFSLVTAAWIEMPRDLEPSLNTRNFTLGALQSNLRLDGRALAQSRALKLSFGENLGCAYVELGKTKYALFNAMLKQGHGTDIGKCGKAIRGLTL
jgi:hypothetical protein